MAEQQKYDRQLRLWGIHGQRKLMNSHVCLLNAGPTGTEALKNLVLPGIGKLTVVDPYNVTESDCTNNFFVDRASIGKPRAVVVASMLVEMNADVQGYSVVKQPREIIKSDPKFLTQFSLILAMQLDEQSLIALGDICASNNIPLIVARTYGLIGHVRVYSSEHRVIELKPSPQPAPDLRVANPWPALKALADSVDLKKLDGFEYKHVPFLLILIKAIEKWKSEHNGKAPESYAQKEEFRKSIKAMARLPWGEEENLTEAFEKAFVAFAPYHVTEEVNQVMNDKKCDQISKDTPNYWILARALRDFYTSSGNVLPLPGTLPDMTATTESFIELQKCFSDKAKMDFDLFSSKIDQLLKQAGKSLDSISTEERSRFCSNASGLVMIRSRTLRDEFTKPLASNDLQFDDPMGLEDRMNPIVWYLLFRACDALFAAKGAYPGQNPSTSATELEKSSVELFAKLKAIIDSQYPSLVPSSALTIECAEEMVRYGGVEMHPIAALIGGIAAQESVKLLTEQYQPINNTFVYNGICAVGRYYTL